MDQDTLPDDLPTEPIQTINPDEIRKGLLEAQGDEDITQEFPVVQQPLEADESNPEMIRRKLMRENYELRGEVDKLKGEIFSLKTFETFTSWQKAAHYAKYIISEISDTIGRDPLALPRIVLTLMTIGESGEARINQALDNVSSLSGNIAQRVANPFEPTTENLDLHVIYTENADNRNENIAPARVIRIPMSEISGDRFSMNPRVELTLIVKGNSNGNTPDVIARNDIINTDQLSKMDFIDGNLVIFLEDGRKPEDRPQNSLVYDYRYYQEGLGEFMLDISITKGGSVVFKGLDGKLEKIPFENTKKTVVNLDDADMLASNSNQ